MRSSRSLLIKLALLNAPALVLTGCGSGGSAPGPPPVSTAYFRSVIVSNGTSSTVQGALPTGTTTAPALADRSLNAIAGDTISFPLMPAQTASQILVGVEGEATHTSVSLASEIAAGATVNVTVTLVQTPPAQAFTIDFATGQNGAFSQVTRLPVQMVTNPDPTGPPVQTRPFPRATKANWSVLIYMNAANNLEPYSVENLDQMEQAAYSPNVNIVVQWKRLHESPTQGDLTFDPNAPLFDGTRRLWLSGRGSGQIGYDTIQDLGSGPVGSNPATVDMGDWRQLQSFVQWGETNFPANHYMLLIWDHGAGWEHRAIVPRTYRGVSYDDQSGNSIETWQLSQALAGQSLDVIAEDCSLMQMAEVDYQIMQNTPLIVASEDSPPGDGYPYQLWLPNLTQNPNMTASALAQLICDTHASYYATHADSGGNMDPVTQSVVDTSKIPALAQALSSLGNALYANRVTYASALAQARDTCNIYVAYAPTEYPEYKDLVQYCNLLKQMAPNAPGLSSAADAVIQAVRNAVLDNKATGIDTFSNGLSIYVPKPFNQGSPPQSYDANYYPQLQMAKDTSWAQWLDSQQQ